MNSSLSIRRSALAKSKSMGHMVSTADVDFSVAAQQTPDALAPGKQDPLSDGLNPPLTKRNSSGFYQERMSWGADATSVLIIRARRPLQKQGNSTYKPTGPWQRHAIDERVVIGKPSYMSGAIPELPRKATNSINEEVPAEFQHGMFVSSFLPTVVQQYLTDKVLLPHYLLGNIWSYDGKFSDVPIRQEVELIRVGDKVAITVKAMREIAYSGSDRLTALNMLDSKAWNVDQYTFYLQSRLELPGSKPLSAEEYFASL